MTLRDKFKEVEIKKGITNELEQIADDYAIEFAAWIQFHSELWIRYNRKELLQIFKKEKGL